MVQRRCVRIKRGFGEGCHLFFTTLSNPTRLAILELLKKGPRSVTEIATTLRQEQSMISHNLKPLVRCGFVFVEPRWKERIYSINKETMEPLFEIITKHFNKYCALRGTQVECLVVKR